MRERPAILRTSSLWAVALGGVMLMQLAPMAATPAIGVAGGGPDYSVRDTYYVMNPFGSMVVFGVIFAVFAAFYFWCEHAWGRRYDDRIGQVHLWLTVAGAALFSVPLWVLNFGGALADEVSGSGRFAWLNGASALGILLVGCGVLAFIVVCLRGLWSVLAVSGDAT